MRIIQWIGEGQLASQAMPHGFSANSGNPCHLERQAILKVGPFSLTFPCYLRQSHNRGDSLRSKLALTIFLLLIGGIFFFAGQGFATDASLFSQANSQYQNGNFKEAAAGYEKIISQGNPSAAVYYNLGNAYFRLNQKGRALISYERALEVSPRDRDVLWNKNILKTALPDHIEPQDEGLTLSWIRKITDFLSIHEIASVFSGLLFLFMIISALLFLIPPAGQWAGRFRVLLLVLFLPVSALFVMKWLDVKDPTVVVLSKEVYARYGPSDTETKAFLLHEGAEAKVRDETEGWLYVGLANKNSGWVPKESCGAV